MEPFDDWAERITAIEPAPSVAKVMIDDEVVYACAKDMQGRVIEIWNPDDIDVALNIDALH